VNACGYDSAATTCFSCSVAVADFTATTVNQYDACQDCKAELTNAHSNTQEKVEIGSASKSASEIIVA